MSFSVIPVQSWACSSRWGESGWRVSGPGSIPRWLSYTWRLRSQERSPQWAPSHRSKRSSRPDRGWRGPPDSHTAVPVAVVHAPASSAPVPWSWVSAGNSGLPRKAGESPGRWSEVSLVCMHHPFFFITVSFCYNLLPKSSGKKAFILVSVAGICTGHPGFPMAHTSHSRTSLSNKPNLQLFQEYFR